MKPRTSVQKRALEISRLERKEKKQQRREQRKVDGSKDERDDGVDPDIAEIIPGPQPPPEQFRD